MSTQKTCSIVLGIDPGISTGLAHYSSGKLVKLETVNPFQLVTAILAANADLVVYEDSRRQSHVWAAHGNIDQKMKIARNVGQVDAWCWLIEEACKQYSIKCSGVSPKGKGHKLSGPAFDDMTGWGGQSNQHTRDAAMCAWPYRMTKSKKEAA